MLFRSTVHDIKDNPHNFTFQEAEMQMLPQSIDDLDVQMTRPQFSLVFSIGVYPLSGYTKYSLVLAARGRACVREGGAA